MTSSEVFDHLEQTGALLNGHFELRSGLHSDRFFQCANVLRYPSVAEQMCQALVEKMCAADLVNNVDTVIAPALGGILVGYEITRALESAGPARPIGRRIRSIFAEKQADRLVLRRFKIEPGARVLVAEDVVTRGGRVRETMELVKAAGGEVAAVALLVDRSGGKARFEVPVCSLLEMEPVTWTPDECPLCRKKVPFVHPGS